MTVLEQISHETMVFMRGKYHLDEIGNGSDVLKFIQGQRTIVTIYIHEDKFTFLIVFGKRECECFALHRSEFSQYVQECYDKAKIYHDKKKIFIDVNNLEQLEEVEKLILIKKKPNRKRFSNEYPGIRLTSADYRFMIHTEIHYADEITLGILPYLPMQYEGSSLKVTNLD